MQDQIKVLICAVEQIRTRMTKCANPEQLEAYREAIHNHKHAIVDLIERMEQKGQI